MKRSGVFDLKGQVGRGSGKKPSGAVSAQRELSLGARLAGEFVIARISADANAVSAAAIPLRKPTPGRRTEDLNAHLWSADLELCAHVGVDFAAENNFFENRTGPSHKLSPLGLEIFPLAEPRSAAWVGIENHTTAFVPFVRESWQTAWPEGAIFGLGGSPVPSLGFPSNFPANYRTQRA